MKVCNDAVRLGGRCGTKRSREDEITDLGSCDRPWIYVLVGVRSEEAARMALTEYRGTWVGGFFFKYTGPAFGAQNPKIAGYAVLHTDKPP